MTMTYTDHAYDADVHDERREEQAYVPVYARTRKTNRAKSSGIGKGAKIAMMVAPAALAVVALGAYLAMSGGEAPVVAESAAAPEVAAPIAAPVVPLADPLVAEAGLAPVTAQPMAPASPASSAPVVERSAAPVERAAPVRRTQTAAPAAAERQSAPTQEAPAELTGPLAYSAVVAADGEASEASATTQLNASPATSGQTATPAPRIVVEPMN